MANSKLLERRLVIVLALRFLGLASTVPGAEGLVQVVSLVLWSTYVGWFGRTRLKSSNL
jgi:hypothetical protein